MTDVAGPAARGTGPVSPEERPGHLADNIVMFARLLRSAGLAVGPGQALDAVRATRTLGIVDRDDFYWCLHAVFVRRRPEREIFDQAFHVFWRNPRFLERLQQLMLPTAPPEAGATPEPLSRRLQDALGASAQSKPSNEPPAEIELDATLTWSAREVLREQDFEQMSTEELNEARRLIARLRLPLRPIRTRRHRPTHRGSRVDLRATLRQQVRNGPDSLALSYREPRDRPPALVVICDISGSMSRYSRMLLHFAHAIGNDRQRVFTFVFGTRLTHVSRRLRGRDVDSALAGVAADVNDWSGGTRLGQCLADFNRLWSRRVLAQGAVVLLITDGLDRDAGAGLAVQAERLAKSCRRLVWLNPLLRYDAFEPRAAGMRALLPHVDELRPVHNLVSLESLCDALSGEPPDRNALRRPARFSAPQDAA